MAASQLRLPGTIDAKGRMQRMNAAKLGTRQNQQWDYYRGLLRVEQG